MILVFFILFIILGFIFSNICVYVENFYMDNSSDKINTKFNIKLKFKLYSLIPILCITLKEDGLRVFGIKIEYKKFIENERLKKVKKNFKISKVKFLKPNWETINIKLSLGTESMVITPFLVTFFSVVLSFIFKKMIRKFDMKKYKYIIKPMYEEENRIFLELKGRLNIKTSNIIECIKYI